MSAHTTTLAAVADAAYRAGASCTIVVDGMALIRKLYTPDLEWVVGGQYQELWLHVQSFVRAFEAHGLRLVVFIDGGVDDAKLSEWRERRTKDLAKVNRVVTALSRGEQVPTGAWMPPPNISKAVGGAFAQLGCKVYYTAGEADRELASYCESQRCAAVLAKDSDFFILPVAAYLNLDTLALHSDPPTVTVYMRKDIEAALGAPTALLPLVGSLIGNDFVPSHALASFHRAVMPGRHAHGSPLIEAVVQHVSTAANAAGWLGPCPATPLLWCALDWDVNLSPEARSLVERSLEQYAITDDFAELSPSLVERGATASAAMLRRFRRGCLDSACFTAATRNAIWRGPSIDDPDAPPTIISSRPIRCEMYSACLREARHLDGSGSHDVATQPTPHAHKDGADKGAPHAASCDSLEVKAITQGIPSPPNGGRASGMAPTPSRCCVIEHIIYQSQPEAGAAEVVPVPQQLMSCEAMWALPPVARCACLLRSLGRACRGDVALATFDPTSVIALGPLALGLFAVRFLRRHGLASRAVALVMLCQGIVMAWLAKTRQRLPADLRQRPRGAAAASLRTAHLASLFTRVTTDLVVLNSACGEPLLLHGPWEWFDGRLFEWMLNVASSASPDHHDTEGVSSCWSRLLRGDERLLRLFELLRPVALAGSTTARSCESCEADVTPAAAAAWRSATSASTLAQIHV